MEDTKDERRTVKRNVYMTGSLSARANEKAKANGDSFSSWVYRLVVKACAKVSL